MRNTAIAKTNARGFGSASQPSVLQPNTNEDSAIVDEPRRPLLYLESLLALPKTVAESAQTQSPLTMFQDLKIQGQNVSPVVIPKPLPPGETHFLSLQSWEGHVLYVSENSFTAHVVDKTTVGPDQEVEFAFDEVTPGDHSLIQEGAIFYWDIGYSHERGGQRIRSSLIQFRRLPAWTAKELNVAKERALKLRDEIGWSQ